jgi:hypothetical protein
MQRSLIAAYVVCLTLVSACGGGGGGGGGSSTTTPVPSATIAGTAAKGLLLNAIVNFYPVTNGVAGTVALASTRTDTTDGSFSASVSTSGSVVVALTVDNSTQMLDEISGDAIAAPPNLTLHVALTGVTNLQPIAVTPLTEMAYELAASASGGLNSTNINAANGAVGSAFLGGASILSTKPINLSGYMNASVAEQALAKLLTAFALAADQGIATGSTGSVCGGTYPANIPCMIDGLSTLISLDSSGTAKLRSNAAYLQAAYEALDSDVVTVDGGKTPSLLGLNVVTSAESMFATEVQQQIAIPGYSNTGNPVQDTKDLIANIRTNIIDQSTTQTFGYAPQLTALTKDLNLNVNPIVGTTASLLSGLHRARSLLQKGGVAYDGACGYDPTNLGTATNVAQCRIGYFHSQLLLTVTQTDSSNYSFTTQILINPTSPSANWNPVTEGLAVDTTYAALPGTFVFSSSAPSTLSVSGPYYVDSKGGQVTASLSAAESSNWNSSTDTGSISLSGTLAKGKGDITFTSATLGSDSVINIQDGAALLDHKLAPTVAGATPASISGVIDLTQFTTAAFSYSAKLTVAPPAYDASGTMGIPASVTLDASIDQIASTGNTLLFSGSLGIAIEGAAQFNATKPVSATNTLTVLANASGTLSLPGSRILTVSATAKVTEVVATPSAPDSFTVTYSYTTPQGIAQLNASGQYDNTNGLTATITNNAGVMISVAYPIDGPLSGSVTADGAKSATISGDFIYYSDGSSESLF